MKHLRPSAEFRDIWQYNNCMYTLLGYLPELLLPSKKPLARYVKELIFEPLGMTSTTYSYWHAKASGNLADGMTRQGVNFTENPFGNGTVRAKPFWSQIGGENGNSVYHPVDVAILHL
jgi:CubicO group peptidase (beta-lactamase class C family)